MSYLVTRGLGTNGIVVSYGLGFLDGGAVTPTSDGGYVVRFLIGAAQPGYVIRF